MYTAVEIPCGKVRTNTGKQNLMSLSLASGSVLHQLHQQVGHHK